MKLRSITIRVPSPREEPTPVELLRQRLVARARLPELRRRLALAKRRA